MAVTVAGIPAASESDGKSVNVTLTAAVVKGAVIVVEGWVGLAGSNGAIGAEIALIADDREYQFRVPASLAVAKGDIVYITAATITGHYPDDEAYTKTAGAGKVAFFKASDDQWANNFVPGVMLAHNALAS